ncbi:MAG: phosphate ABC transporter permease PstA [Nitrospinae bacterium]|nr:phosphate ABC transporter permease PstA [Nitrospinota bacterium]MBF0634281.1 phosphate ABC transporter permease PstA [Nitrospinota bacterium]
MTGGALAFCLIMVTGLVALIMANGLGFFWPGDIYRFTLKDGREIAGQLVEREQIPGSDTNVPGGLFRIKVKQANRDLYGTDFVWIDESAITKKDKPADAILIHRREWGDFIGVIVEVTDAGKSVAKGPQEGLKFLKSLLPQADATLAAIYAIEKGDIGQINYRQDALRLEIKKLEIKGEGARFKKAGIEAQIAELGKQYAIQSARIDELKKKQTANVKLTAAGGVEKELPLQTVVRVISPNTEGVIGKTLIYMERLWEFLSGDPREANTEGGVFPAIFGTVMLVLIMSVIVTPFGVVAAFYLREYAKQGTLVSIVRIAVNNLAGVPSIVFGVFGVGFFIYFVGGGLDRMFFPERLPAPTFGTGGILWASLTLALLTLPVVIVSTEEGLAQIPKGLREASLALGATKFETTWRVALPAALPSIMTGLILAMARAAGEVAPLMITGVVKLAPALPLDGYWPFVHLERKFMHLGFHIYDVGFQSPNVDAARPMVYTTTLLLLLIVVFLTLGAIMTRNRLRKKFAGSAV